MREQRNIDPSLLHDAMQREDREQDDVGLHDLRRQIDVFEQSSGRPHRWALRDRASAVWDESGARR